VSRRRRLLAALAGIGMVATVAIVALLTWRLVPGGATSGTALGPPRFVDETAASGLTHAVDDGYTASIGGGMAVLDCDEDGLPDLYLAGGANPAALYRNVSVVGGPLRFSLIDDPLVGEVNVDGAYPIDVDGDGHTDLAVLRVGGVDLLRGLGGCRFERANDSWSFAGVAGWATAFSATWEGSNALPTLAIGQYLQLDPSGELTYDCDRNAMFRPDAAGGGYGPAIPLDPGYCALSMLFSDWNGSGRRDLRVSNDRQYYDFEHGEEQLWQVLPDQPPRLYGPSDGWVQMQLWGMGIASQDVTGDGLPEVYLTSQADNKLQTLLAGPDQPTYRDIALKRGVIGTHPFTGGDPLPSTAWHPEFEDVNNDGFWDLFVSKGNVNQQVDYASRDPSNLFIGQADGTYVEGAEAAGILSFARGRGAALADFNLDGLLDLVEVNLGAPTMLWRNVGTGTADSPVPMGSWLALRVAQPGANRDAIGAVVEVRAGGVVQRRELTIGGGHISGQLGPIHFGIGQATSAEVRVRWPDGEQGAWLTVAANQYLDITRGAPDAVPWASPGG
jgi:enediyne biosynthesis protein E4